MAGILKLWALIGYELEMPFTLVVDPDRCQGCTTCVAVCPKGVFAVYRLDGRQKSRVIRYEECEQCTACVKQCPERAILADPPIRVFERAGGGVHGGQRARMGPAFRSP